MTLILHPSELQETKALFKPCGWWFTVTAAKPVGFWQYSASAQTLLVQSGLLPDPFPGCSGKQRFSVCFQGPVPVPPSLAQVAVTSSSLLLCYPWHLDCNYGISQGEMQVYSHVPMFPRAGNSPTVVYTCMVIGLVVLCFPASLPEEVSHSPALENTAHGGLPSPTASFLQPPVLLLGKIRALTSKLCSSLGLSGRFGKTESSPWRF